MKNVTKIAIAAGLASASAASAQVAPGTILFTSNGVGSTAHDTDGVYSVLPLAGATPVLVRDVFPNDDLSTPGNRVPSTALVDIEAGPDGSFFIVDQGQQPISSTIPIGADPSPSKLYRIDDLFGAAPISVQFESAPADGGNTATTEVQRPIGVVYSARIDRVINVNNPTSYSDADAGLATHNPATPGANPQLSFEEAPIAGLPNFQNGTRIIEITEAAVPTFYAISLDGGTRGPGDNSTATRAGALTKFTFDGSLNATETTLIDFGVDGLDTNINLLAGLDRDDQGRVFIADAQTDTIYMITDPEGAFTVTPVLTQTDYADLVDPGALEFNPFTGKFVLAIGGDDDINLDPQIVQFDPDDPAGTVELIASGFTVGGFEFVPAPSSAAVIGLAGLFAARRRRA